MNHDLTSFLREELGIIPTKGEAKFPTRDQGLNKNFYNTMNLTQEDDGSWTPNF